MSETTNRPQSSTKSKKCLDLFLTFLKIGGFTFGGGYAMIPLIQREAVESKKWITDDDILEIIAIAESTPGPIAINSATFVGYRVAGVLGSLCATLGVVLPSFIIILAVSFLLQQFQNLDVVRYAFFGIRAAVLGLIAKAAWTMFQKCKKHPVAIAVMLLAFLLSVLTDCNVLIIVASSAIIGLVTSLWQERRGKKS